MNRNRIKALVANGLSPYEASLIDKILSNDENGIPRSAQDNQLARQLANKLNSKGLGI